MWSLWLFVSLCFCYGLALVAYDCKSQDAELTKISLCSVKPCLDPRNSTSIQHRNIQLVQKRHYVGAHVFSCRVSVSQQITHCGMNSHSSVVAGGMNSYFHQVSRDDCLAAHRGRQLDLRSIGG